MQSSPPGWHYPFSRESPSETFSLIGACQAYPGSQWENRRITISLFGTFIDLHCSLLQCLGRTRITQFHRKEMASLWMESGVAWHNPEEKGTLFISVFLFFFWGGARELALGFFLPLLIRLGSLWDFGQTFSPLGGGHKSGKSYENHVNRGAV